MPRFSHDVTGAEATRPQSAGGVTRSEGSDYFRFEVSPSPEASIPKQDRELSLDLIGRAPPEEGPRPASGAFCRQRQQRCPQRHSDVSVGVRACMSACISTCLAQKTVRVDANRYIRKLKQAYINTHAQAYTRTKQKHVYI